MDKQASTPTTAPGGYTDGRFGAWGEPAVVVAYGPSGVGKTTDLLYSLPSAFFIAQKGALKPFRAVVGLTSVWQAEARTLDDAIALTEQIARLPAEKRPYAVVGDDLSLLADNTLAAMEESGKYKGNGFKMWGDLRKKVQRFANIARWDAGIHTVLNSHEQAPFTDDAGTFWRGGPRLPSKKLSAIIPHVADTVLKGRLDSLRTGVPWQGVYDCFLSESWLMKDRHGHHGEGIPMNVGELLRSAGYTLPYAAPWMATWVDRVARSLEAGKAMPRVRSAVIKALEGKATPFQIRSVLRDGIDRNDFRKLRAGVLDF